VRSGKAYPWLPCCVRLDSNLSNWGLCPAFDRSVWGGPHADTPFSARDPRLNAPIGEGARCPFAGPSGCVHQPGRLKRAMDDEPGISLDLRDEALSAHADMTTAELASQFPFMTGSCTFRWRGSTPRLSQDLRARRDGKLTDPTARVHLPFHCISIFAALTTLSHLSTSSWRYLDVCTE
jgi:hypothetical protein